MHIVCKFGGSSTASETGIRNVLRLSQAKERRFFTFSALGKRREGEKKITDLLIELYPLFKRGLVEKKQFEGILERFFVFSQIPQSQIERLIEKDWKKLPDATFPFLLSRGEFWTSKLMSTLLDIPFVDSVDCIFVDGWDFAYTREKLSSYPRAVVPAFYGKGSRGIALYPRGGGDITGSVLSRGTNADLYENWTDVEGVYTLSPKRKKDAVHQPYLTFTELKNISYFGGCVFHPLAIAPLRCPLLVASTFVPEGKKTFVGESYRREVAGVCERNGNVVVVDDFRREKWRSLQLKEELKRENIPMLKEKVGKGYALAKVQRGYEQEALFTAYRYFIEGKK